MTAKTAYEELNKKLAEWAELCFHEWEVVDDTTASPYSRCRKCLSCGLKYSTEIDEYLLPKCADGEVYFNESLDACRKWLVPKLAQYRINIYCKFGGIWEVQIYNANFDTVTIDKEPALALCFAIENLINREGK